MKNTLSSILRIATFAILSPALAQTSGSALADGAKTSSLNFDAGKFQLNFPIAASDIKSAFNAKRKGFQYAVKVSFENAGDCGSKDITNWQDVYEEASLSSMAGSGNPMTLTVNADDINGTVEREFERCGWASDGSVVVALIVPNKSGKMMTISQINLTIPANAKSASLSSAGGEILKLFKTGLAANAINDRALAKTVENYMENKWPSEDITTVHITDQQYQNVANTAFKVDGYYITRNGGNCKYNSFYGDGKKTSGGYSITFFNSMNAETSIDCGVADQLQNM